MFGTLFLVTLLSLPPSAWQCEKGVSVSGSCLRASVAAGGAANSALARAPVDLSPFVGGAVRASIRVSAKDLERPAKPWWGLKVMLHYKDLMTGEDQWVDAPCQKEGSFAERELVLCPDLSASDPVCAELVLGLQQGRGEATFDLTSLRLERADSLYPQTSGAASVARYSPEVRRMPRRRGVMLSAADVTEADLRTLHEWGVTLLRFQIMRNWQAVNGDRDLGEYDRWIDGRLAVIESVLGWAGKYGQKVVIDLHSPPGGRDASREMNMFHETKYAEKYVDVWRRIAKRLKGRAEIYGYDLLNEPTQKRRAVCDYWTLQRRAAEAIRAVDPKVVLIVEANEWASPQAFRYLRPFDLQDVVYQVHLYEPHSFTHQGVSGTWERQKYPVLVDKPTWDYRNKDWLRRRLSPVRFFAERYGAKIYVGEFSAVAWAQGADRYLADCISLFEEYGWDWTYHAFREWTGWSVEHDGVPGKMRPSEDNPRKRVLLDGFRGRVVVSVPVEPPREVPSNPLSFLPVVRRLVATYANETEASQAELSFTSLPGGRRLAFTTRWDDSNERHLKRTGMLQSTGFKGTFYLNRPVPYASDLLTGGNAIGNHTARHLKMGSLSDAEMFREVVGNRIDLECACSRTVNSFVIPYGWTGGDEERFCRLSRLLVDSGHWAVSDHHQKAFGSTADLPMATRLFDANDAKPDPVLFEKRLQCLLYRVAETPDIPRVTFGLHSWCDDDGLRMQKRLLERYAGNPEWWYCNDADYAAYRYAVRFGGVRKIGCRGRQAVFEVTTFDPAQLGGDVSLTLKATPLPVELRSGSACLRPEGKASCGLFSLPSRLSGSISVRCAAAEVLSVVPHASRSAACVMGRLVDADGKVLLTALTSASTGVGRKTVACEPDKDGSISVVVDFGGSPVPEAVLAVSADYRTKQGDAVRQWAVFGMSDAK